MQEKGIVIAENSVAFTAAVNKISQVGRANKNIVLAMTTDASSG